ncbi:MAG: peptide chain release factor N(5)-glutamine methyltransferase [Anaerolineae bacterium]|nr:peptide chain release factor N(5)-glutamine methyltransferase [Anaerolineae bacterium]
MRVDSALQEGVEQLQAMTSIPHLEAERLLSHATGFSRARLLAHPEHVLPPKQLASYRGMVQRRAAHYPLPYLTGWVEFYSLAFAVTPDVLIPRPETETLVELALRRQPRRVIDVGTGSGCIAVALALHLPQAEVLATDISAAALRVAAANARQHGLHGRIRFVQCDLVAPLQRPVDLLVSNPPYVAREEWDMLPASARCYEPRLALDGERGGLATVRRLLARASRLLEPGGAMLIEIGAAQGDEAARLARAVLPGAHVAVHPDLAGRDRVLEITAPAGGPLASSLRVQVCK